ncbi:hypothetical protein CWN47_38400, partial [Klebsiella variicola]
MPAFEWVHVQLHQQKGMISLSPPTICNSALAREGRKMSSRDLAKFTDVRRYATLVCIITEARATLTDEVID